MGAVVQRNFSQFKRSACTEYFIRYLTIYLLNHYSLVDATAYFEQLRRALSSSSKTPAMSLNKCQSRENGILYSYTLDQTNKNIKKLQIISIIVTKASQTVTINSGLT